MLLGGKGMSRPCALFFFAVMGVLPMGAAAEPALNIEVGCPDMTPEQLASVEARSRAELAMIGITGGDISIHCWPPLAVVEYSTGGVPVRSSSQHLVGSPDAWVEDILSIVHKLLSPNTDSSGNAVEPADAPTQQPTAPPSAEPPASLGNQPSETRTTESHAPPVLMSSAWKPESSRGGEPLARQMGIGACAETWAAPLAILPGVCALIGLRSSLARIALTGGVQWSASRVHDISVRHWHAGVEASFGRPLWFALSGQLSVFQLVPRAGFLPESTSTYDPALTVRGGISLPVAKEQLLVGVGVRLQPAHDVYISKRPEFSVPVVALTTDVAYEFGW